MVYTFTPNILLTSEYLELRISDQKENIIFDLLCVGVNPLNMIFFSRSIHLFEDYMILFLF